MTNQATLTRTVVIAFGDHEFAERFERCFRELEQTWCLHVVGTAEEVLAILKSTTVNVLFTDLRLADDTAVSLLKQAEKHQQTMLKFIMLTKEERSKLSSVVSTSYRFITKQKQPQDLAKQLRRAAILGSRFDEDHLKPILADVDSLPSLPYLYREISVKLQDPDCSISEIDQIIRKDVGMTAKVLQLVNSAYFGLPSKVENLAHAVSLLGIGMLRSLVLTAKVFDTCSEVEINRFGIDQIYDHSVSVGAGSGKVIKFFSSNREAYENASTAGMMHDVGKLILIKKQPELFAQIQQEAKETVTPLFELEKRELGTTHAEIGAYLLDIWGLPESVVQAVAFHHEPSTSNERRVDLTMAVHLANAFQKISTLPENLEDIPLLDLSYVRELELVEQIPEFFELVHSEEEESVDGTA